MKKEWILACVLLFVAVAAFAQTPSQHPLSREALAAILGLPATGSCATQPSGVRQAAKRPAVLTGKSACTATANCGSDPAAFCSGDSSCTAVDRNCSVNEPGHVTCDGNTFWCPTQCTTTCDRCCQCAQTGECLPCCRCAGGNFADCLNNCG
jgi:hypothetical protein